MHRLNPTLQAADLRSGTSSESPPRRKVEGRAKTRPVPDSWIAAVLLLVIAGCVLFAAASQ